MVRGITRQKKYNKLESKMRTYWRPILFNAELNIFHLEKYKRDLETLKNI